MSVNRVAILIDGGFFLQRFKANHAGTSPRIDDVQPFIDNILQEIRSTTPHASDFLLRTYYYDCRPNGETKTDPKGRQIDFSKHPRFFAANSFQNALRTFPQLALRLGELSFDGWKIDPADKNGYIPDFKQKSVDIKLGLDIAWLSSKKIIDKLVIVAGDSDFIPPMKFARREGILVYLHPMGQSRIKILLREHADFVIG